MNIMETNWLVTGIIFIVTGLLALYYKVKKSYQYFAVRDIPYVKPTFLIGSSLNTFLFRETIEDNLDRIYKQLSGHKMGGYFQFLKPTIILRDPELIESVLIKDFSYFMDHIGEVDIETNPMDGSLFNLKGQNWKILRTKLSPIFTSGKLKWMINQIFECSDLLVKRIEDLADGRDVNIRPVLTSFGMEVIGSCAFGIETQDLAKPDSPFKKMVAKIFSPSKIQGFKLIGRIIFPKFFKFFKIRTIPSEINDFFIGLTKDTIEDRLIKGYKRNDFVELLLQLKVKGSIEYDEKQEDDEDIPKGELVDDSKYIFTYEVLAAQAFIFFLAGFDTTTTLVIYTLYYLSKHPEIQNKVREEITSKITNNNGLNYEAIQNMTYLDCCISETLRLQPPAQLLIRECTKTFRVDEKIVIEKGSLIMIPVKSLHYDPQYFSEPEKYMPERFLDSRYSTRQSFGAYLPFGDGPRVCIARRFALLQSKVALVKILTNFEIIKSPKNIEPLKRNPRVLTIEPKGGLHLRIKKIHS